MDLEKIPCPVCGSFNYRIHLATKDFRLKTTDDIFNVVICQNCSFEYLNPRPKKEQAGKFYTSDFNRRDKTLFFKIIEPCFKISQKYTIKRIKKYKKVGRALDVGCGNGEFLSVLKKNGYDVWGAEPNCNAKSFCEPSLEKRIIYRELCDCKFKDKSFDIITMFQSLEHVYDLESTFKEINRIIKDDGIIYISVPNHVFWEFILFGKYFYNLEVPRHIYFFNKDSLTRLLNRYGFQLESLFSDLLVERVSTPAAFYHSLCYFFEDKGIALSSTIKYLMFIPLVLIRLCLHIIFVFQSQNLQVICRKR